MDRNAWKRPAALIVLVGAGGYGHADVADLFTAFEMGGRALGMGGAIYSNSSDVSSIYWNPAGLGGISESRVEINFRNKPDGNSTLSGRYDDPERETDMVFGGYALSYGGFVIPVRGGTIGFSYALGGYTRDRGSGNNLTNPDDPSQSITKNELLRSNIDFFTLAYGRRNGRVNFGVGVVVAHQAISHRVVTTDQNNVVLEDVDVSGSGWGVGGIIGVQFVPQQQSNVQFGFSYRSEIKLNGLDDVSDYVSAVPARLQGGIAWRADGLRGGRDFLVGGVDAMYFFPASGGKILKRDGQISAGIGFEYNWAHNFGFLPIRLGFRVSDAGGDNFSSRDVLTFGLGYRPRSDEFTIDVGVAAASGQSRPDVAVSVTFPFGK